MSVLHAHRRQQGAVLVIAMVLLLVMSLIGLSSVVSSTLQERMASNVQQRALAHYAAETPIRPAEVYIATSVTSKSKLTLFDGNTTGLYAAIPVNPILFLNDLVQQTADTSKPASWTAANSVQVLGLSDKATTTNPRYMIEYVGRRSESAFPLWSNSAPVEASAPHIFKITAIGWARDSSVYSVLQSHFTTGKGAGVFDYEE